MFKNQDDWLYFNKPFTIGELQQTAYHMVTSWNQRRQIEALFSNMEIMQNGLLHIINTVSNINKVPPLLLDNLLQGILKHYLDLLNANDGFISLITEMTGKLLHGYGAFKGKKHEQLQPQWEIAVRAMHGK